MATTTLRILLVDEDADHALPTLRALRSAAQTLATRLECDISENGRVALDRLLHRAPYEHALRPSLVLLDLKLPLGSGFEVLCELKADSELRRIPLIVMTTSEWLTDILRRYDLHANEYVVKPSGSAEYVKKLGEVLSHC